MNQKQASGYIDWPNVALIKTENTGHDFKNCSSQKVFLKIPEEVKTHPCMAYTTEINTLELIFKNMTLRSSSLSNINLNDPVEKERVGVTEFACSRFITCFCQIDHEVVPFWIYYGKNIRKNKVLLQFRDFSVDFEDCIHTDYALVKDEKKCFFGSKNYGNCVNISSISPNSPDEIDSSFDLSAYINSISMFNVEYVPLESSIFSVDNTEKVNIDLEPISGQKNSFVTIQGYDPTVLGKQKSNPWDYEKETRILVTLSDPSFSGWDYIDLRLKPAIFKNLKIVLSPWGDDSLREHVEKIIRECSLPQEIKDSITIVDSGLKGKLNFPE